MLYGKYSLNPATSNLVEIFVFSLCTEYGSYIKPHPKDVAPPVWLLILLYTPYTASTYVCKN